MGAHIVKNWDTHMRLAGNFMVNHKVSSVLVVLKRTAAKPSACS